jgi:hypothetical protein
MGWSLTVDCPLAGDRGRKVGLKTNGQLKKKKKEYPNHQYIPSGSPLIGAFPHSAIALFESKMQ